MRAPVGRLVGQSRRVPSAPPGLAGETYSSRVSNGVDDTEQVLSDGSIYLNSYDLELGHDDATGAQAVGVRFRNVSIPQGGVIESATLKFTSNEASQTVGTIVRIYGEDADNSAAFSSTASDVSSRTKTTAYVDWTIPTWSTDGQSDSDTTSPDLSIVVREIVNRVGWSSGNALSFIIEVSPDNTSTTPRRSAISADQSTASSPFLTINGGASPVTPSSYSLLGDESFDRLNLDNTESDVNGLTYRDYYDKLYAAATNGTYDSGFNSIQTKPGCREGALYIMGMFMALRLVGDLRLLDEAVRLMELWHGNFSTDGNGYLYSSGTDDPFSLDARLQAGLFAWVGRACQVNSALTSPAGYTYSAIASKYRDYVRDNFLPRWRGKEGTEGPDGVGDDGSNLRHPCSSIIELFIFIREMGGGGGFTDAQWEAHINYFWDEWFEVTGTCTDGFGGRTTTVYQHAVEAKEDPPQGVDSAFWLHFSSYLRYTFTYNLHQWMEGGPYHDERMSETFLTQVFNSFADFTLDSQSFTDQTLAVSIGGTIPEGSQRCGIDGGGTSRIDAGAARWMLGGYPYAETFDSRGRTEQYGFERYAEATGSTLTNWTGYYAARMFTWVYRGGW